MINGVSGSNYFNYQNMMNMMRLSSVRSSSMYQKVDPVKSTSRVTSSSSAYTDIQDFLQSYQSKLTGLEASASKLSESSSKNVFNDYQVAASDSSVVEAKGTYRLKSDTDITLDVQSLAQAQKNVSSSHNSQDLVEAGADMNFEIAGPGGKAAISISSTDENGISKTYNQMYQDAAKAINAQSGTGVRASVSNVNGKVSLVLQAQNEGEAAGFRVSGNMGAAAGAENAAVAAQDAVYSVTENGYTQNLTSSTNNISLNYGRIEAELKGTGESKIYTKIDEDEVVSAVKDLVDDYNDVTKFLKENSERGTGVASHLASFGRGMADEKTLNSLGISYNKNGELEVDAKKLKEALEKDFEGTKSKLGGQFGIADKAAGRAEAALSTPVQRVVNRDLESASKNQTQVSGDSNFQYFSSFARSGPYNITNYYAVGMLFNTMA